MLWIVALLMALAASAANAQSGTVSRNVSSASTQMTYAGLWRSQNDTIPGLNHTTYVAYSNASDAAVTFDFLGVGVTYLAVKKNDRGLAMLTLDNSLAYTVDCYDSSGVPQTEEVLWQSPTLPYGRHNVTLSQIGVDSRIGFYPYLYTETWIEVVPTNVASYVATEATTTATAGAFPTMPIYGPSDGNSVNVAAVAGGVVGGVIALVLFGFLFYMYRRDKRKGIVGNSTAAVSKVKRGEEKMAIDDNDPWKHATTFMPVNGFGVEPYPMPMPMSMSPQPVFFAGQNAYGQPIAYFAPSPMPTVPEQTRHDASMYDYSSESTASTRRTPPGNAVTMSRRHLLDLDSSVPASTAADHQRRSPRSQPSSYDDGSSSNRSPRSYPYVQQGFGSERRTYPVPEI